jgi:hypothetical protein
MGMRASKAKGPDITIQLVPKDPNGLKVHAVYGTHNNLGVPAPGLNNHQQKISR